MHILLAPNNKVIVIDEKFQVYDESKDTQIILSTKFVKEKYQINDVPDTVQASVSALFCAWNIFATQNATQRKQAKETMIKWLKSSESLRALADLCVYAAIEFKEPVHMIRIQMKDVDCMVCSKNLDKARYCGGCKMASYCSIECQRKDWKHHKKICTKLGPTLPKFQPSIKLPIDIPTFIAWHNEYMPLVLNHGTCMSYKQISMYFKIVE